MRPLPPILFSLLLLAGPVPGTTLKRDAANLFTYENLGIAAVGLGMAGIARHWDSDLQGNSADDWPLDTVFDITNLVGASSFNLPASLSLWGAGKGIGHPELEKMGSTLIRTLAFTQVVVGPIKHAVGRRRPDDSNRLSFPSGHTANSFAVARLLHRYYGGRVGLPMYIFSGMVAAGRIEADRHFLSDVVMGAFLGTIVGSAMTLGGEQDRTFSLVAVPQKSRPYVKANIHF